MVDIVQPEGAVFLRVVSYTSSSGQLVKVEVAEKLGVVEVVEKSGVEEIDENVLGAVWCDNFESSNHGLGRNHGL